MRVGVGCPVSNRAWILPSWFDYVNGAFEDSGVEPEFFFVCGTSTDETQQILQGRTEAKTILWHDEDAISGLRRGWNLDRYAVLAELRNLLLGMVRESQPDYFLSLDSDILIHPHVLTNLLEVIQADVDAVGGKVYLSQGTVAPNYAIIKANRQTYRPDHWGVTRVDALMALKLMAPAAYSIDYVGVQGGEDIGWSNACRAAGLRLMWDGRIASKHVMDPARLDMFDKRVGY